MTISDTDLNKLTRLGIPSKVRRDAVIALNLNGIHSERKARNARARCAAYWTTVGMDDPLARGVS